MSMFNEAELANFTEYWQPSTPIIWDKHLRVLGTVPQRFLRTILTLRIRKVTLRRNNRSRKIRKSDLFVELCAKLRTIHSVRK